MEVSSLASYTRGAKADETKRYGRTEEVFTSKMGLVNPRAVEELDSILKKEGKVRPNFPVTSLKF